jgi:hypothetical protein
MRPLHASLLSACALACATPPPDGDVAVVLRFGTLASCSEALVNDNLRIRLEMVTADDSFVAECEGFVRCSAATPCPSVADGTFSGACTLPAARGATLRLLFLYFTPGNVVLILAEYSLPGVDLVRGARFSADFSSSRASGTVAFDADDDGAVNLAEVCAGTDPLDAAAPDGGPGGP